MRRVVFGSVMMLLLLAAAGCDDDLFVGVDVPAAPRALTVSYYGGVVTVQWELAPDWNGEAFRVYSRRVVDPDYFLIAEVTNCVAGGCSYDDINIVAGETYEYYVSAVDVGSGVETASDLSVEVFVPSAAGPPVPGSLTVISLDGANYVTWANNARSAEGFSFYRVFQATAEGTEFLLGETDSEGFLDLLAENGVTYGYFVIAVDTNGHESAASGSASGTPRPDFHGEWLYDHFSQPSISGFRFMSDEDADPIRGGSSPDRHFRLEVDDAGWWLVPGLLASVYSIGFETTSLKCGVGADAGCIDLPTAPTSGYVGQDVQLESQSSYVLKVVGDDGQFHYGVIRVEMLGYDQDDNALMIFDWAYQLQAGNPDLVEARGG